MDKELLLAFVLHFTSKTLPPTFSMNDRRSLKRKAKQGRMAANLLTGSIFVGAVAFYSLMTTRISYEVYMKEPPPANDLYLRARDTFSVPYLRLACADVVANCSFCADSRIHVQRSGPMVHCSMKKRKVLSKKIGIKWRNHFKTSNHEEIAPSKIKPKLVICPRPDNCVCTTLSDTCKILKITKLS